MKVLAVGTAFNFATQFGAQPEFIVESTAFRQSTSPCDSSDDIVTAFNFRLPDLLLRRRCRQRVTVIAALFFRVSRLHNPSMADCGESQPFSRHSTESFFWIFFCFVSAATSNVNESEPSRGKANEMKAKQNKWRKNSCCDGKNVLIYCPLFRTDETVRQRCHANNANSRRKADENVIIKCFAFFFFTQN